MQTITPAELHEAADAHILDVREPDEVAQAHLEGSQHIPLSALAQRLDEVPRDRTVYVMCHVEAAARRPPSTSRRTASTP